MIPRHPVSETHAAAYHIAVAVMTLCAVWYHVMAAKRHWDAR
jgi:hypothetical protein